MTIQDLREVDMEVLGKFVQGFTKDDLESLSGEVKVIAIQKLGEYTGLPEDKLKSRANFAYNYLKVGSPPNLLVFGSKDVNIEIEVFASIERITSYPFLKIKDVKKLP